MESEIASTKDFPELVFGYSHDGIMDEVAMKLEAKGALPLTHQLLMDLIFNGRVQ